MCLLHNNICKPPVCRICSLRSPACFTSILHIVSTRDTLQIQSTSYCILFTYTSTPATLCLPYYTFRPLFYKITSIKLCGSRNPLAKITVIIQKRSKRKVFLTENLHQTTASIQQSHVWDRLPTIYSWSPVRSEPISCT